MSTQSYIVPECNLAALEFQIEKLNKRCRKLGLVEITMAKTFDHVKARVNVLTVNGTVNSHVWMNPTAIEEANKKWPHSDTGERMTWWKVEVTGEQPTLNGWRFISVLEPMKTEDGETLNMIMNLPGNECPEAYRNVIGQCDHCKVNRRRSQTFVVCNEANEFKCVGRQCIKDFLGYHADPHTLVSGAEMLAELYSLCLASEDFDEDGDNYGGSGRRGERSWDLTKFLTMTACRVRLFGWVSRGQANDMGRREDSTASKVMYIIDPPSMKFWSNKEREEYEAFVAAHVVETVDLTEAENAIEWIKSINPNELENSNYLANCNLIARIGTITNKTAGIAASIIVAYYKVMEFETKRQQQAARPESNHIGIIGERIAFMQVKCEKVIMKETNFGVTGIHKMVDDNRNDLIWFSSTGRVIEENETVFIAATVKDHGEYQGRKQTILSRATVLTTEQVDALKAKVEKKAKREAKKLVGSHA